MIFDYFQQKVFTQSVQVDDIGNAYLRCSTSKGFEYYFASRTIMGKTSILKFGPCLPDVGFLVNGYSMFYKKIDYKENLIEKEINLLINDPKKEIEMVEVISLDEIETSLPALKEFFGSEEDLLSNEDMM